MRAAASLEGREADDADEDVAARLLRRGAAVEGAVKARDAVMRAMFLYAESEEGDEEQEKEEVRLRFDRESPDRSTIVGLYEDA